MTLFESIKANPIFANTSDATINSVLLSRGFDGSAEYTGSEAQVRELELVSADLYVLIAMQPSWKEGQLSVTYDPDFLISRAMAIYGKYDDAAGEGLGDREIKVTISDASDFA